MTNARFGWVVLVFCGLVVSPADVRADLAPPGGKFVSHWVHFENLADYPETAFFLGWYTEFGQPGGRWMVRRLPPNGQHTLSPPEGPPYISKLALAAAPVSELPAGSEGDPQWFASEAPGIKVVTLDVGLRRTAPATDLRDTYWTAYRVHLGDSGLTLERTRNDEPSALLGASLFVGGVAAVLFGMAGLTYWLRRRRAAPT